MPGDAAANPLSGTYTGYIESYQFPDGSDTVVMTLDFTSSGAITGTVFFGSGPALPAATDPNVGYPPGLASPTQLQQFPLEGFDFTILGGAYSAPRVQLSIDQREMWKHWCEIQTTIYPVDNGNAPDGGCGTPLGYGCLPNAATMGGGNTCAISWCEQPAWTPVDCGKLQLCMGIGGICTCTATACTVPVPAKGGIAFDMQLASGALDGSVTGLSTNGGSQVYNVHLKRGP